MVLIKNQTTSTINTLPNYGGEVLYNTTTNKPVVNTSAGFNYFVLSSLTGDVTGLASLSATSLTGTLQTAAQPNVTSLGTLTGLTSTGVVNVSSHDGDTTGLQLGGTLVTATAAQLNYNDVTAGTAAANKALVLDGDGSIVGITNLETDNLTVNGTLVTASAIELNYTDVSTIGVAQASKALVLDANLSIVGINNLETDNLTVNGTLVTASATELNYTDITTAGTAQAMKALVVDINKNISGINVLTTESVTLSSIAITATGIEINKLSGLTASTTQLNYLSGITTGTATANKALVVDSSSNISGISTLSANSNFRLKDRSAIPLCRNSSLESLVFADAETVKLPSVSSISISSFENPATANSRT